ncbi:MAG: GNAT family N-acetyltransferase [Verrucomicrobiota bacterium]
MNFPKHWTTERTRIDSVKTAEAESLAAAFNSCSDVLELDPTFRVVDPEEVLSLVEESERCEASERGFRMQAIRLAATNELLGYFHFRESTTRPDVVALSIFFIRPGFRSQGFGREVADGLLKKLSDDPRNQAVWARVYLKNNPALRLWTKQGFTRVVEHKGQHIHVDGEHLSVILERSLQGTAG